MSEQQKVEQEIQQILDEVDENWKAEEKISFMEPILREGANTLMLSLTKKISPSAYNAVRKSKINLTKVIDQALNFSYEKDADYKSDVASDVFHNQRMKESSGIKDVYDRKDFEDKKAMDSYKEEYFKGKDEAKSATGETIYRNQKIAREKDGSIKRSAETDHKIAFKDAHSRLRGFQQRYGSNESLKKDLNSPENLQMLSCSENRSKGAKSDFDLKSTLKTTGKSALTGTKTVATEQIGQLVIVIVGPISYEIRESFNHGESIESLWERIKRVGDYICKKLPSILGECLKDLAQMIIHLVVGFFTKIGNILANILSFAREVISILWDKETPFDEKLKLILKALSSLAVGVAITQFLPFLDSLGPIFTPIVETLVTIVISTIVMKFFLNFS